MNAFFNSQFNDYPLAWMFHSRKLNNKINKLHERCLRIIYSDSSSTFERLLTRDNSVSIHDRNSQVIATEMFKVFMEQGSDIYQECVPYKFSSQPEYNLRKKTHLVILTYKDSLLWRQFFKIPGTKTMRANTIRYYRHRVS